MDTQQFIKKRAHYESQNNYDAVKKLRIDVMNETSKASKTGSYTINDTNIPIPKPQPSQYYEFNEYKKFMRKSKRYNRYRSISVQKEDCLNVAKKLVVKKLNPVVLNMACAKCPGGGYKYGAGAQEETICRRSNYCDTICPLRYTYYPLPEFSAIYSPSVTIFRDTEENGYAYLPSPFTTSFIAMPAYKDPILNSQDPQFLNDEFAQKTKQKMRIILHIASENRHNAVVLSAMGCGAYKNPPRHVAKLFDEVLNEVEFKGLFREVIFAIVDDRNTGKEHNPVGNFQPFYEIFSKYQNAQTLLVSTESDHPTKFRKTDTTEILSPQPDLLNYKQDSMETDLLNYEPDHPTKFRKTDTIAEKLSLQPDLLNYEPDLTDATTEKLIPQPDIYKHDSMESGTIRLWMSNSKEFYPLL